MQSRHWCFTINNWTAEHDDALRALGSTATYLVYGYETGQQGTPHIQGYVVFPVRKRFSAAKAALPGNPHVEVRRGTPKQAADYCKKDGVYQEYGTPPTGATGSSCFDDFIEWVLQEQNTKGAVPSEREIARKFPLLWLRNERKLRALAMHLSPPVSLVEDATLQDWQIALRDILVCEPENDRKIMFFVDEEGGKGKSFFQRYMVSHYPDEVQLLSVGKRDDIAHAVDPTKSIFLFNIPRGNMEFLNYGMLEQLKDRVVFSPKYDSGTKFITKNPHVVVFCNEFPDQEKMTYDRFAINTDFE